MKIKEKIFLALFIIPLCLPAQKGTWKFEKSKPFFAKKNINQADIADTEWGYLTVPENWDKTDGKTVKIAVSVLKSKLKNANENPIVFIEGGPGAGGIEKFGFFLKSPLREKCDVILIDVRGTGFSYPKLCPDLGKRFLEILSENNTIDIDEQKKATAAIACKQDMIDRNIDIHCYNSNAIAKDLHALKQTLGYKQWNIYGVSYGTYMAKVYANNFPADISTVVLDSPISDITGYYTYNSSNYMNSLKKVFENCAKNPVTSKQYPNLEKTYYETIDRLTKSPITIEVDKKIIPTGEFTYNAEDFKVAIQQALYNKKLIEVLPLLITEFHNRNIHTLGALVSAFSSALRLDYGMYYCVTCDEVIPYNSIVEFEKDAQQYKELKGGLSFYKSDFVVCDKWNLQKEKNEDTTVSLSNLTELKTPVLVLSGGFDPITPSSNGKIVAEQFRNSYMVEVPLYGHAPGFSKEGRKIIAEFVNYPNRKPDKDLFLADSDMIFISNVKINGGITNFANSLGEFNYLFLAPLCLAFIILLVSFFVFTYSFFKNRESTKANKIIRGLIIVTSLLGCITLIGLILAVNNIAQDNFFILAFGVPDKFSYLFGLQLVFIVFTMVSMLYYVLKIKSIGNRSVIFAILFSFLLINVYFKYWGF